MSLDFGKEWQLLGKTTELSPFALLLTHVIQYRWKIRSGMLAFLHVHFIRNLKWDSQMAMKLSLVKQWILAINPISTGLKFFISL